MVIVGMQVWCERRRAVVGGETLVGGVVLDVTEAFDPTTGALGPAYRVLDAKDMRWGFIRQDEVTQVDPIDTLALYRLRQKLAEAIAMKGSCRRLDKLGTDETRWVWALWRLTGQVNPFDRGRPGSLAEDRPVVPPNIAALVD